MRILVISDSHGLEINNEIIDLEKCDLKVHCGDSQLMRNNHEMEGFDLLARGNCDLDRNYAVDDIKEIQGLRLMATHGHYYDVNYSLQSLVKVAINEQIDIVFYGHTHVVNTQFEKGVLIINPGSIRQSRSAYPTTYIVVEVLSDQFIIEIKDASSYTTIDTIIITK